MPGSIIFPLCRMMADTEEKDTTKIRQYYLYTQRCVMSPGSPQRTQNLIVQCKSSPVCKTIIFICTKVFTDTEGNTEPDSQTRGLRTDSVSQVIPRGGEIYRKIIFSDKGEEMLHLLGLRWKLVFFWHSFWVAGALSVLAPPTHGLPG